MIKDQFQDRLQSYFMATGRLRFKQLPELSGYASEIKH